VFGAEAANGSAGRQARRLPDGADEPRGRRFAGCRVAIDAEDGAGGDCRRGGGGHLGTGRSRGEQGGAGDDSLSGDFGDDELFGGLGVGNDTLSGGSPGRGADTFDFAVLELGDVIKDFTLADGDRISVAAIDANGIGRDGDQPFTFIGQIPFTGTRGQLRQVANGDGSSFLEGNVDADLAPEFRVTLLNFTGQLTTDHLIL
jgi:hypothetical protein